MRRMWSIFRRRRVSFIVFGVLIIMLWVVSAALGLGAYFIGGFITAVLILLSVGVSVLITPDLRTKDKVLVALLSALQRDRDPRVRSEAAEGLADLELEQSSYSHKHNKLDDIIFEPRI